MTQPILNQTILIIQIASNLNDEVQKFFVLNPDEIIFFQRGINTIDSLKFGSICVEKSLNIKILAAFLIDWISSLMLTGFKMHEAIEV